MGSFQGRELFGGGPTETLTLGLAADDRMAMPSSNLRVGALGELIRQDSAGAFTFKLDQPDAVVRLREGMDQAMQALARVGAAESRVALAGAVATTRRLNHEAALSGIQDADVALETTRMARIQLVQEGHTAMLSRATESSQRLIPLLRRA
jgi:flagellin